MDGDTVGAGRHQAAVLTQLGLLTAAVEAGGGVHGVLCLLCAHPELSLNVCCGVNTDTLDTDPRLRRAQVIIEGQQMLSMISDTSRARQTRKQEKFSSDTVNI